MSCLSGSCNGCSARLLQDDELLVLRGQLLHRGAQDIEVVGLNALAQRHKTVVTTLANDDVTSAPGEARGRIQDATRRTGNREPTQRSLLPADALKSRDRRSLQIRSCGNPTLAVHSACGSNNAAAVTALHPQTELCSRPTTWIMTKALLTV